MIILTMRTDKPEAEIGLYEDEKELGYQLWQAHRQLAETLHSKIANLLQKHSKDWSDIQAIVVFEGPGSFTGLRIGFSVANALAYSLQVPVVGASGDNWRTTGFNILASTRTSSYAKPQYGQPARTTTPKK
ncbi:MAG: tRNA (adenosine(37)-N6)-threonylcarbamoyltransferase complex dimerization subunit type 1 TsaB [Candidatus Saccharibacteria bacterium]|nr:tRNA (adenosine(37)-N6)-threonylcarbamoyltransferase complex dimerization subunit type 1 TsaB [Candidatus Saccharibacteria bacterium]